MDYSMFLDRMTQNCDVSSPQIEPCIQQNPNKSSKKLICKNWQADSKIYIKNVKILE